MRLSSKIFAIAVVVTFAAACGGSSESPPKPLQRHFDELHVAKFTLEQKADIVKARNDWEVARMENAQSEAQLAELDNQIRVVKNEQKAAKLALDSAKSNKAAADKSADTNRINAATQELRIAELGMAAADARSKYFDAFRAFVKRKSSYTLENMYWREAQFEVSKAKLAQANSIAPKGIEYDWYPKQETERSKRAAAAHDKTEAERLRAASTRDGWLKAQQAADQASGKPTSLPDPMAPPPEKSTASGMAPAPSP
ncbi:MAG TPA: hypothetical protein VN253_13440 [Kofleriaceae bacterium]|nr:hypothetical protein [Kofleriaceae bacterium]